MTLPELVVTCVAHRMMLEPLTPPDEPVVKPGASVKPSLNPGLMKTAPKTSSVVCAMAPVLIEGVVPLDDVVPLAFSTSLERSPVAVTAVTYLP